ncbi:hypothetical protein EGI11_07870 [Chryseobacterium sp. H3056]|uniref:Uncharacterized protein n=1 Tax=Kaistella daneshvariae TaxID=2487074 RepID=A0A3N0WW80_9FLAO|nr:hypothetical protein EGI11_07870 [Kaistella daneshvariae]
MEIHFKNWFKKIPCLKAIFLEIKSIKNFLVQEKIPSCFDVFSEKSKAAFPVSAQKKFRVVGAFFSEMKKPEIKSLILLSL